MKEDYLPRRNGDLDTWETNFEAEITAIATALGYPVAEITAILNKVNDHRTKYAAWVAAQAAAKAAHGTAETARAETIAAVRFFVSGLKKRAGYTTAMGETLKIIGEDSTFDPSTAKPELELKFTGGNVVVKFSKPAQIDSAMIYSKRGSETEFSFLAIDSESPYEDTRANLNPGQPEIRHYKAVYYDNAHEVGLWGDEVAITVTK